MLKQLLPKVVALALFLSLTPQAFALSAAELDNYKKIFSSSVNTSCVSEMNKQLAGKLSATKINNYCSCVSVESLKLLKTSDFEEMAHMKGANSAFSTKMESIGTKAGNQCVGTIK
jgi:hypothetical protein